MRALGAFRQARLLGISYPHMRGDSSSKECRKKSHAERASLWIKEKHGTLEFEGGNDRQLFTGDSRKRHSMQH